MTIKQLQLT